MVPIFTLGNPRDLRLFYALRRMLSAWGPVLSSNLEGSWIPSQEPSFLLEDRGLCGNFHGRALFILKDTHPLPPRLQSEEGSLAVLCSHNRDAVQLLADTGLQAVTCGLSPRDTVTFSSLEPGRGTIALQRPLQFPGGILSAEPREFPTLFPSHWNPSIVLCCAATAAVLGFNEEVLELCDF